MENERVQEVLDLVVEYGQTKHNRKKRELLQKIENILTQPKEEKYGKPTETTDREEGTETSSASIERTSSAGLDEGCE